MYDYSIYKCRFLEKEEIWRIADKFRDEYWPTGKLPINIETIIENELNMHIIPEHGIKELAKIDSYLRSDLTGIVVDERQYMDSKNRYENRLRFSFAHEIGHYMLHKYIYEKLKFGTTREYYDYLMNVPVNEYKNFEWQANEFAGRLLVPMEALKLEIEKAHKKLIEIDLYDLIDKQPEQILESISPTICKPFGVSELVIEKRAIREDLWPPRKDI